MNNIDTIYLDMDGVIVDFRKGCEELNAIEGFNVDWEKIHANGSDFWANLNWTTDGKQFYTWLAKFCNEQNIDLCILSAVNYDDGINGKLIWIKNNINIPQKNIYIVKNGKAKAKFANNSSLLIDDFGSNIKNFVLAGGKGIKFKSAEQTKQELLSL